MFVVLHFAVPNKSDFVSLIDCPVTWLFEIWTPAEDKRLTASVASWAIEKSSVKRANISCSSPGSPALQQTGIE